MTFFLFPGQGSQCPGMVRDFYEASPVAHEVLDDAEEVLGEGFLATIFEGSEDEVRDTRVAQTALVSAGVAIARHLASQGVSPSGCAGHSVGEITALVVSRSLDFGDALRLTRERARLMAEETPAGGMLAVMGLALDVIESNLPQSADMANYNGPKQTIVSCADDVIDEVQQTLKDAGAKQVIALNVSGPFHSRHMKTAGEGLRTFLEDISVTRPKIRFISSVSGQPEDEPATIRDLLWKQLSSPVRWTDVMMNLTERRAIEVGPGRVLRGLAKRIKGAAAVESAGTLEGANALRA